MQKMPADFNKQIGKLKDMHQMQVQSSSTTVPKVDGRDITTLLTRWIRPEPLNRPRFHTSNSPKLSSFSRAEPPGKEDMSFDHWIFIVQAAKKLYFEEALQQGIIQLLRGNVANTVWYMGPDAEVDAILS